MNVEGERKGSGTKTRVPNNKIESGSGATNKHVENPGRRGGGHERRADVLLWKIGRHGMRGVTVTSVNSGNIMKAGNRSGVGNDGNGGDRSIITINIGGSDLQFNFLKKNRRILPNGLKKGSPSAKIVMKNSGDILVITKSKGTDMTGLGNETGQGKHRRGGSGDGWGDWLRTLGRGANRSGHDDSGEKG